ncbi:cytochrome c oxidase subunit 3 [Sulfurovum sp. TSL1]|uniref:cytochrome c oxidase subunit 3 n=1 Tax=Sulfurovum sp. TSL1 TaxID=2826994 RepID=UPI001CC7238D|nr:cytochrome c oxidase subunit 3 [Sulfurovum sp. TSL1]GIT98500.1 cytochrome oxidase subunit III [Sulfurovum sp. TSL1]
MKKQEMAYDPQGNGYPVTDYHNDPIGSKLGFWIFLLTEMMMFGILFLLFAIYFYRHTEAFSLSSGQLNVWLGGTNTVILLVSTYTMGLSTMKMHQGKVRSASLLVGSTALLAVIFLSIKAIEWSADIQHGLYPGSAALSTLDQGEILFFGLYFTMTGLHGLHIIIGIILMSWALWLIHTEQIRPGHTAIMKNMTLYWDFVHIIWVILFPLFYMIGA